MPRLRHPESSGNANAEEAACGGLDSGEVPSVILSRDECTGASHFDVGNK